MATTVRECLNIGILKHASVEAGEGGLDRSVTSVTVCDMGLDNWTPHDILQGNELIVSSLNFSKDDVGKQCEFIISLNDNGASGLVIFYLGIYLKQLNKEIIDLSNKLNFPLIVLPKNRNDFAYVDVIKPITTYILNIQSKNSYLFLEIITEMNDIPLHCRNLKSVVKIVGQKNNCNLLITNVLFKPIEFYIDDELSFNDVNKICDHCQSYYVNGMQSDSNIPFTSKDGKFISYKLQIEPIIFDSYKFGFLIILKRDSEDLIPKKIITKIVEVIKFYVRLLPLDEPDLNNEFNYVNMILNGNESPIIPYKDEFLPFNKIDTMVLMKPLVKNLNLLSDSYSIKIFNLIKLQLRSHNLISSMTIHKDKIVIMLAINKNYKIHELQLIKVGENLISELNSKLHLPSTMCFSDIISSPNEICKIFNYHNESLLVAKDIFPLKSVFSHRDMDFVYLCLKLLESSHNLSKYYIDILNPLLIYDEENNAELLKTLQIFLLDCNSSIHESAKMLFIHPNTMKYRLKRIEEILGYSFEKYIEQNLLMFSVALNRCVTCR
jgi:hypothetical protein